MGLGLAVLRAIVGGLFMGHGLQKLAGWFGGAGLKGTGEFFEALEMKPGPAHAAAAGAAEAGGGAMLLAGAATPLGASLLSGTMITAIRKVHAANGVGVTNNGFEYNLVLLAAAFAITAEGPGRPSLDAARGRPRWGFGWALAQLAAGAAGSLAAVEIGRRQGAGTAPVQSPEGQVDEPPPPGNGNVPSSVGAAAA
ncbi:MAG TPA: DoxX family protein [Phenylobacterium sp.]|nr:DoxX family protein [Phenylobacterium sp.]